MTAATGHPVACNLCHLDATREDTARHLREWYGLPDVALSAEERETSASLLWLLKGNAVQWGTAAWHYGWAPALEASGAEWQAPFLAELLDDPCAAVRYAAARSLGELDGRSALPVDPNGPRLERWKAKRALQARCQMQSRSRAEDPRLLLHDGRVIWERALELLSARDDSPITVAE